MAVLTLCWLCGCSIATVATRAAPSQSPLHLELATIEGDVHAGAHVTLHVRLWNTSAAPIRDIDIALSHAPSLVPVGGAGSTVVHTDYGALQVERILQLDPGGLAEWWLVLRAVASGDAPARVTALLAKTEEASFETAQWRVVGDASTTADVAGENDPSVLSRAYLALSRQHGASGRRREELHALYAAHMFMDQSPSERVADTRWADVADRARELYLREYGAGPTPLRQAALPRTSILTGFVVDSARLSPIADATITLRSMLTDAIFATATTSHDGAFQITDLCAEPVVMITAMPGYAPTMQSGFELHPNTITRLTTELRPESAATSETWDLAELYGTLSGYRGDGARDVEVILVGTDTLAARTDEQGQFRFTDVTPGDYTFVAQKPGFAVIERRALRVTPGGEIEVQFTLEPEQ